MSKSKKASKRKRDQDTQSNLSHKKRSTSIPTPTLPSPKSTDEGEQVEPKTLSLSAVASEEEVEITVDTLRALAEHPAVIKGKGCKDLRTAVYDFRQACTTGSNTTSAATNLTARISAALVDGKHIDALVLLAEMRIRDEPPKLGALCRWVRDLDAVSGLSLRDPKGTGEPIIPRTTRQLETLRALDAVLRVTGTTDLHPETLSLATKGPVALQELWDLRGETWSPIAVRDSVLDKSILESCPPGVADNFRVLETTRGPDRKPPNLHDAVLYMSSNNAVLLSSTPPEITFHRHAQVPNLSLMRNVLSADECKSIIAATETVGFLPDAPVKDDGSETSILAHNVYWVVDNAFHDILWERVRPFVPAEVEGRKARSINRRFRVYRYVPGAEYRCHFDGAWPPSGVDSTSGMYLYDASPADGKQSSLFTFLVYLNDEFEGGETTFFTPSIKEGVMNAHPVRPIMGSIALFPHGESKGALLHEGTGVRKGAKYIIRTDVEYDVDPGR
ncbi:Uu.00g030000.m01.CDS01 [Anthostomella pinea]|uniref:Uu.00g030000.m01.CDS01 n=1 Tax=Anthostomella pinea TaxID=933095 RepID=A0AAI8YCY4_9PEZI|nr:Uu.00g030000.m01.CDS01 [Anthostomella pinea]